MFRGDNASEVRHLHRRCVQTAIKLGLHFFHARLDPTLVLIKDHLLLNMVRAGLDYNCPACEYPVLRRFLVVYLLVINPW